jgi:hypothetical protein
MQLPLYALPPLIVVSNMIPLDFSYEMFIIFHQLITLPLFIYVCTGIGCYNIQQFATNGAEAALAAATKQPVLNDNSKKAIDVAINVLRVAATAATRSGNVVKNVFGTGFCIKKATGKDVFDDKVPDVRADYGCKALPLNPDENYLIVNFGVESTFMTPLCPAAAVTPGSFMTFCLAVQQCGTGKAPTAMIQVSSSLAGCFVGNTVVSAASAGLSSILQAGISLSIGSFGVGFSASNNLQKQVVVYNPVSKVLGPVTVNGMLYGNVAVGTSGLVAALGLNPKFLGLGGSAWTLVAFGGVPNQSVVKAFYQNPSNAWNSAFSVGPSTVDPATFIGEVAAAGQVSSGIGIGLSAFTGGGLPDFQPVGLFQISTLVTSMAPAKLNNLPQGLYLSFQSGNVLLQVAKSLFGFLGQTIGVVFDFLLPAGFRFSDINKKLDSISTGAVECTMSLTKTNFNLRVQIPLGTVLWGATDKIILECNFVLKGKFGCSLTLKDPYVIDFAKEGTLWVARNVRAAGDIIAAVALKMFTKVGQWTLDAIQRTGQAIKDGLIAVDTALTAWAYSTKGAFLCGSQQVGSGLACGATTVFVYVPVCTLCKIKNIAVTNSTQAFLNCLKDCRLSDQCSTGRSCKQWGLLNQEGEMPGDLVPVGDNIKARLSTTEIASIAAAGGLSLFAIIALVVYKVRKGRRGAEAALAEQVEISTVNPFNGA